MKTVFRILLLSAIIIPLAFGTGIAGKSSPKPKTTKATKVEKKKERPTVIVGAAKAEKNNQKSSQKTGSKASGNAVELQKSDNTKPIEIPQIGKANQSGNQQVFRTGEQINWQVISAGGGFGSSTNFGVLSVLGQTAVGEGSSTNFTINSGFVQTFGPGGCCVGLTGNIDNDPADVTDITDLTVLIDHLFINFPPLVCPEEGNIDGDPAGTIDITDLTVLIDHLFINFPPTSACQ